MKFAHKCIPGGPVHLCPRPLLLSIKCVGALKVTRNKNKEIL